MKLRVDLKKWLFIIFMMFVLNVNSSLFYLDYQIYYPFMYLTAVLCITYLFVEVYRNRVEHLFMEGVKGFLIPMVLVTFVSVVTAIYVYQTTVRGDYTQSLRRLFFLCEDFLIAYVAYKGFGMDIIRLIAISGMISYFTVICRWFYINIIDSVLELSNGQMMEVTLEVHEVTYIFGMILIYYLLNKGYTGKFKTIICMSLLVGIVLGNKRALYLGIAVALFVYWIFQKFSDKHKRMLLGIAIVYFIFLFVWLYLVKSGVLESIMLVLGIETSSRFRFWNYFKPIYELNLNYLGRGISYTSIVMASAEFKYATGVTIDTELHNDILRTYIGWGCIPFVFYYLNFIVLQTRKFVKCKMQKNSWIYFSVISYMLFIYLFDNMFTAFGFNVTFFAIWFSLMDENNRGMKGAI